LLAGRIKAELIESYPRIKVVAKGGAVYVGLEGGSSSQEGAIRDILQRIPGVEKIDIKVYPFVTPD
jgi:hypothetical protein